MYMYIRQLLWPSAYWSIPFSLFPFSSFRVHLSVCSLSQLSAYPLIHATCPQPSSHKQQAIKLKTTGNKRRTTDHKPRFLEHVGAHKQLYRHRVGHSPRSKGHRNWPPQQYNVLLSRHMSTTQLLWQLHQLNNTILLLR